MGIHSCKDTWRGFLTETAVFVSIRL